MAEQTATVHRPLEDVDTRPARRTVVAEILDFVALDDELMANLDSVIEMDAAALATTVAARDRMADRASGIEALAERTIARALRAILAEMRGQGTPIARNIVSAPGDVYNHVVTAAEQIAEPGSTERDVLR